MSAGFYADLFNQLASRLTIAADAEITLEANPGAIDAKSFTGFAAAGINRLSLGVQSFSDHALKALGRIHNQADIYLAYDRARSAGFDNINLDLMHGLPGQSVAQGLDDLNIAFELNPEHISWYQLTIERNTVFYNRPPVLPVEDILDELCQQGQSWLAANGFQQYEVSAYAKANFQSAHNLNYWHFGDYLGVGAGAHGKLTLALEQTEEPFNVIRRWKTRMPEDYMAAENKLAGSSPIVADELPLEFMMNALRLNEGFTAELFEQRTGLAFDTISEPLQRLREKGLLEWQRDNFRATAKGRLFLNDLVAEFSA